MDEAQVKIISNFLASLLKLIRYFKLYPPNHPYITDMIQETDKAREEAFKHVNKTLKVAIMGGVIFIGKDPVDNPNTLVKNLIKLLTNIKIKSFEMDKSMTTDEMVDFCKLAAKEKEELLLDGGKGEFNAAVLKEFKMPHVKVNEIEVKLGDEEEDGLGAVKDMLMGVDEALGTLGEKAKAKGAGGAELSEDRLMAMVDAILSRATIQGANDPVKAKRSFDEIGDMLTSQCEDINDLKKNLLQTVFRMPPEVQKNIFGEAYNDEEEIEMDKMLLNLSIRNRANIVRNALKNENLDIDTLKETLGKVVQEEGEVVELAEIITKEFGLTASSEEEKREYISRLSALIQSGLVSQTTVGEKTFAPRVRGTVLIAEDDIDVARVYQRLLHPAGFETILYTDGQQALDGIK
ncbi:MAG: DNA-binding response regulator, partial [Planctomycetota bacterium]